MPTYYATVVLDPRNPNSKHNHNLVLGFFIRYSFYSFFIWYFLYAFCFRVRNLYETNVQTDGHGLNVAQLAA